MMASAMNIIDFEESGIHLPRRGRNKPAQGNTLGKQRPKMFRPERATQMNR